MEKTPYNILWLDDDFMDENRQMSKQLNTFKKTECSKKFRITAKGTVSEFVEEYSKEAAWDAAILDVYGYKDNGSNKSGGVVYEAINCIDKDKTLVVIYTETFERDEETASVIMSSLDGRYSQLFNKKYDSLLKVFDYIERTLNNVLRRDFPDFDIVEEKIKTSGDKLFKTFIDVMNLYNDHALKSSPYKQQDLQMVRVLMEGVFKEDANKKKYIPYFKTLRECLEALDNLCTDKFVKAAFNAMREFANLTEHFNEGSKCDYNAYGKYVFHALFNELFMCLKWYYCTLCDMNVEDGVAKRDASNNIHVGNVLLPNMPEGWKLHEDFELMSPKKMIKIPIRNIHGMLNTRNFISSHRKRNFISLSCKNGSKG